MNKRLYSGQITLMFTFEQDDPLALVADKNSPPGRFLAEEISEDIEELGQYLTVRYWVSDEFIPVEQIQEAFLNTLYGVGSAEYELHYSEITGYLWTDEELKVGGHDLLAELSSNLGKWLHMEIEFNREPNTH